MVTLPMRGLLRLRLHRYLFAFGAVLFAGFRGSLVAQTPVPIPRVVPVPESPGATNAVPVEEWIRRATDAQRRGLVKRALELADQAVAAGPADARGYFFRAQLSERASLLPAAEADLSRVLELSPHEGGVLQQRGLIRLRRGDFQGAVADFDQAIVERPAKAADLWQRGIALYYAGRYADGRKQFELHRTVNPHDVENSAWHFACVARLEGFPAARAALLPVSGDSRVPMAQIQALFGGTATPAEVLAAAEAVGDPARRGEALFYAHYYLALYHGAEGRKDLETRHAAEASRLGADYGIMGELAKVHADWLAARLRSGSGR